MPDTTPNYGLRIPKADGTDLIVPDDIRVPVTSIDSLLKTNVSDKDASLQSQLDALKARVDFFDTTDPVIVSSAGSIFTALAGWSIDAEIGYKFGRFAVISFTTKRTGAAIPGQSEGNISNIGFATFKPGWAPLNRTGFVGGGVSGYMWAGYADPASGANNIAVGALPPNVGISTDDQLLATAFWVFK
jgi:hypothetical protein